MRRSVEHDDGGLVGSAVMKIVPTAATALPHRPVGGSAIAAIALAIGVVGGERSEPDRERGAQRRRG